jgi:hypothetical protein
MYISIWWIPIFLSIIALVIGYFADPPQGYGGGLGCLFFGGGFVLLTWMVFFALMYFFGK